MVAPGVTVDSPVSGEALGEKAAALSLVPLADVTVALDPVAAERCATGKESASFR